MADDDSLDSTHLMLLAVLSPQYTSSGLMLAMALDRMEDECDDVRDERDAAVAASNDSLARAQQAKNALAMLRAEFTESRFASRQRELARITKERDELHARIAALEAKKLTMTMEIAAVRSEYEPRLEAVRTALRGKSVPASTNDATPRRDDAREPSSTSHAVEEGAGTEPPSRVSDDEASSIDDEERRRPLKRCRIAPSSIVYV